MRDPRWRLSGPGLIEGPVAEFYDWGAKRLQCDSLSLLRKKRIVELTFENNQLRSALVDQDTTIAAQDRMLGTYKHDYRKLADHDLDLQLQVAELLQRPVGGFWKTLRDTGIGAALAILGRGVYDLMRD